MTKSVKSENWQIELRGYVPPRVGAELRGIGVRENRPILDLIDEAAEPLIAARQGERRATK